MVYLTYVPHLGMIYECNYVLGRQRARTCPTLRCLSAAFCALPRLHDCSKLWLDVAVVGSKANKSEWKGGRAVGTTIACVPPRTVAAMRLLRLVYAFCAFTCLCLVLEMLAAFAQEFFARDVEAAILFLTPK